MSSSGRALHLVDLENLAGGTHHRPGRYTGTAADYLRLSRPGPGDLVVAAVDASLWRRVAHELPTGWRVLFGRGPDGADRALLDHATPAWTSRRFDRLVIGSGDHAFAPLARRCRHAGVEVTVIAQRRAVHHDLYRAADAFVAFHTDLTLAA